MMFNQATLLGRVGKIETKPLNAGNQVTNLSLVTSKTLTKNDQREEKVTWHNISFFGKLSEIAEQYVKVGDLLMVQGEIENKKYVGKDGIERTGNYILGVLLKLMPKHMEHTARPKETPQPMAMAFDDAIPF